MSFEESEIKKFFKNQTIFLTGGTGFLGKVYLEKLLRECDNFRKIYIMVRFKKNKSAEERFEEFFEIPCFKLIHAKKEILKKVFLVNGDCQEDFLGLNEQDLTRLKSETTCFIHAAANVKFDQTLTEASCIVKTTRDVLELAKQMPKLKALVYVSTAYSNCIRQEIEEDFYTPPIEPEKLLSLVNILDEDILNQIQPQLLGEWPNTYVFAKCIAEDLVKSAGKNLPISILRPAIITSSVCEPMPGWVDNFYGLAGIITGAGLGVVRSLLAEPDLTAKIVPVDYVGNCMLAVTWKTAQNNKIVIYNYVGKDEDQITWQEIVDLIRKYRWAIPSIKTIWYPEMKITNNRVSHKILVFGLLYFPAYVADFLIYCLRRPTFVVRNCRRLNDSLELTSYFTTRQWRFRDDNVTELWNDMTETDKKLFNFNLKNMDWSSYALDCLRGGKLFLMKETDDFIPKARKKLLVLFIVHYGLVIFSWFLLFKFATSILSLIMG